MNPYTSIFHSVPFFQPTSLLIEKIKCTSEHWKDIDLRAVRAGVDVGEVDGMVKNHPGLGYITQSLVRDA